MRDEDSLLSSPSLSYLQSPPRQHGYAATGPDPKDIELDRRLLQRLLFPETRNETFAAFCAKDEEFFGSYKRKGSSDDSFKRRIQVRNRNNKLISLSKKRPELFAKHCLALGVLDYEIANHRAIVGEFLRLPEQLLQSPSFRSPERLHSSTPNPSSPQALSPLPHSPNRLETPASTMGIDEYYVPSGLKVYGKPHSIYLDFDEPYNNPSGVIPRITPNEVEGDFIMDTMDIRIGVNDMRDIQGDKSANFYQARLKKDKKSFYFYTPMHPDNMTNPKIQESYYSAVTGEDQGKATSKKQVVGMEQKKVDTQVDCRLLEFHFPTNMKGSTKYFNNGEQSNQLKRRINTCNPSYKYNDAGASKQFKQFHKEIWFKIPIHGTDVPNKIISPKAGPDDVGAALAGTLNGLTL